MKKNFLKFSLMLIVITVSIIGMVVVSNAATTKEGILPFEDVKSSYWYADAAEFCYVNGIVNGMDDHTFAPAGTLTRAQFVTMLANIEGVDLDYYSTSQFSDVKSSHWYYGAVAWAYKNGIVSGTTSTTFSPNAPINRETLARMMYLYMQKKDCAVIVNDGCLNGFIDKNTISSWALEGMKYSVSAELISGMTSNTVAPKTTVTRAQVVRIIMLYMEKYYYNCNHYFNKVTCTTSEECVYCGFKDGLPSGHTVSDTFTCKSTGTTKCTVCNSNVTTSQMPHDYAAATCGKPETCKRCSATRGKATGNHNWWAATCTKPKMCKVCYQTSGSALGHSTQNAANTSCLEFVKCSRCGEKTSTYGTLHNWGKATCTTPAKCVRCNKSSGTTAPHIWQAATCTVPKTCKVCYKTDGSALGHSTTSGLCFRCGKEVTVADSCKLYLKHSLPKTVYDYSYSGKMERGTKVTGLKYEFEANYDGTVDLTMYFSGTKTYDYEGNNHNYYCIFGYKIYDEYGNVVLTDSVYSPQLIVGESFVDKKVYEWSLKPGIYYIEIMDVN